MSGEARPVKSHEHLDRCVCYLARYSDSDSMEVQLCPSDKMFSMATFSQMPQVKHLGRASLEWHVLFNWRCPSLDWEAIPEHGPGSHDYLEGAIRGWRVTYFSISEKGCFRGNFDDRTQADAYIRHLDTMIPLRTERDHLGARWTYWRSTEDLEREEVALRQGDLRYAKWAPLRQQPTYKVPVLAAVRD